MEDSVNVMVDSMTTNRRVVEITPEEPNPRTVSMTSEIKLDRESITQYAAEPLLPLAKACAPLCDILYNLSFYVQTALNETPDVPSDELTIDESAAIRLYTIEWKKTHRSLYSMLNHYHVYHNQLFGVE